MNLVWEKTGDCLEIDLDNTDVANYWLSELIKTNKNNFSLVKSELPSDDILIELADCLESTNQILQKFKLDLLMDHRLDWLNQTNLNILHERWVKLQQTHKIVEFLNKLNNKESIKKFHNINHFIHTIENANRVEYTNDLTSTWLTKNIFGPNVTKFGSWQIELHYQNLGRSNFNKWINDDSNINDVDTNNFTHFGGLVYFNISKSYTQLPPQEYLQYCNQTGVEPFGSVLPIGNFKLDITSIRRLFKKNVDIENNRISFKI